MNLEAILQSMRIIKQDILELLSEGAIDKGTRSQGTPVEVVIKVGGKSLIYGVFVSRNNMHGVALFLNNALRGATQISGGKD